MSRHRWELLATLISAISLASCQTDQAAAPVPPAPDVRSIVLSNKGALWKDPESIRNASITPPRRHYMGPFGDMWHVCVRANAKNGFGGYTGEKDMLIGIYDDGRRPEALRENAPESCDMPHEAFPELNGEYRATASKKPGT